jgi:hypothetical protein
MSRDDFYITEAMILDGGSFVRKLAEAFRVADAENQERIRLTWPGYWAVYSARAQHLLTTDASFASRVGAQLMERDKMGGAA